ncbi:hypothetical protein [Sporosarcina sp. P26b]|uniref:hypothetical protein n=1 Tax=Sporosarcina sp. P26b TaxID=2048253 RepID=UPI0013044D82|nr:hypothetical protein [Sporosarcina sp. P26b]
MVGGVMRQPGALPVWLIEEAIHHRRSGANDRPHLLCQSNHYFCIKQGRVRVRKTAT